MSSSRNPGAGNWLAIATRPDIVRRSLKVGLVVGTILAAINHGDRIVAMNLDLTSGCKILLTYLVPYCVSTWASVQTARGRTARHVR
ncbi:MAG: nitrate/nitrite transporter NrtS [Halioglobus sp.]